MGSLPGNNFTNYYKIYKPLKWSDSIEVTDSTGLYFLTRKFFSEIDKNDNIVSLPNSLFFFF